MFSHTPREQCHNVASKFKILIFTEINVSTPELYRLSGTWTVVLDSAGRFVLYAPSHRPWAWASYIEAHSLIIANSFFKLTSLLFGLGVYSYGFLITVSRLIHTLFCFPRFFPFSNLNLKSDKLVFQPCVWQDRRGAPQGQQMLPVAQHPPAKTAGRTVSRC